MTIIKEICPLSDVCILRKDNYDNSIAHFELLAAEAKRDFPSLTDKDIKVYLYGGDRHKGKMSIEFFAPKDNPVPVTYKKNGLLPHA